MSFSRVNPGGWGIGAKVTSAQQNQLDIDHANALDKTGDTVGSGVTITFAIGSTFTCNGTSNINGTCNVGSFASLNFASSSQANFNSGSGAVFTSASLILDSGSSVSCSAPATFNSTCGFHGGTTFSASVTCNAAVQFNSSVNCTSSLSLNSGCGFFRNVRTVSANYTVDTGGGLDDIILVNNAAGAITITLPGAVTGRHLTIKVLSTANGVNIKGSSGALDGVGLVGGSGYVLTTGTFIPGVSIVCDGTNWWILSSEHQ